MVLRHYVYLPTYTGCIGHSNEPIHDPFETKLSAKKYFSEIGIPWPTGSSIKYIRDLGKFEVLNTVPNHELFERVINQINHILLQIEIELKFVSYELSEISKLGPDGINKESLTALWTNGQGKLLAAPKVLTQSGQPASTKGCTECTYPTEYTTIEAKGSESHPSAFEPGSFDTREIGAILDVLAEVSPRGNLINITISPELTLPPTWEDYGMKITDKNGTTNELPIRQPFFHAYKIETNILIKNGHTVLIGGGMPSPDGQHLVYAFLTAKLINTQGQPIQTN